MLPNLVSVVMQFLTPDMIAKIASVLGLDRNPVQKAIGGAVPALLSRKRGGSLPQLRAECVNCSICCSSSPARSIL